MSIEPIRYEVRGLLAEINDHVRQAERTLEHGGGAERVHAAGQLVLLRQRQADLQARLSELTVSPDGAAATAFQWIKEDWMILMQRLGGWLEAR